MEVIKMVILAIGFVLLVVLILYLAASFVCMTTKGKFLGKVFHKINKWHWPEKNAPITKYRSGNRMSYCKYCGKRIISVGRDWFVLKDDK